MQPGTLRAAFLFDFYCSGSIAHPNHPVRPTAFTAEYLAHFLRDTHLPTTPHSQSDTDHPLRASDTCGTSTPPLSYPSEPVADNSGTQRPLSSFLPTAPSSPDTPATEAPSSSSRILVQGSLLQTPSLTTEGTDSSMTSPQPDDSQTPFTSPLDPLSSTRDTPMSVSELTYPGRPHAEQDPEDAQMTPDTEGDKVSLARGLKSAPESTSAHHRRSPPVADDGGFGLPHGLCTPPSETATDDREPEVVSREQGSSTDLGQILRTFLARNLPVTPRSLTPEPSVREDVFSGTDRGSARQGLQEVASEPVSSLTPPLFSPSPSDDVSGQAVAHTVVEEHTDSVDDARAGNAAEGSADAPMYESKSSPRTDQEATNSGVPVITLTNEPRSIAVSDGDTSQVLAGDVDPSRAPRSSGQPNTESSSANHFDPPYSPTNAYEPYFRFSSPFHPLLDSPRPSPTPSRYATPAESAFSDSRPTTRDGDEDEVQRALVQDTSGVSTPMSGSASYPLSTMFSHPPCLPSSVHPLSTHVTQPSLEPESFGVDPSMLHHDPSLLLPRGREVPSQSSPQVSNGTLSPLTSLDDTEVDDPAHPRHSKDRRSEPSSDSASRALVRAASDATVAVDGRAGSSQQERERVGGPSASLDQLALLARREPLRVYLRLPEAMRGLKRKRGEGVDGGGEDGGADGERADGAGIVMPVDEVTASTQVR
jgi:hypothetical protein